VTLRRLTSVRWCNRASLWGSKLCKNSFACLSCWRLVHSPQYRPQAGAVRVGNAYYEDIFAQPNCSGVVFCSATSSATPSDNFFRIQHFYCKIGTVSNSGGTPPTVTALTLGVWTAPPSSGGTQLRVVPLSYSQPQLVGLSNVYNIDHDVLLLVGQNRYVAIQATLSDPPNTTSTGMQCAVAGDMVPPQ
jgi:hypothetical protein